MLEELAEIQLIDEEQLQQQLVQISSKLKAIVYHHRLLVRKAMKGLQQNVEHQAKIRIMKINFDRWRQQTLVSLIKKKIVCQRFYRQLKRTKIHKEGEMIEKVQSMSADNHYERRIKWAVFKGWKSEIQEVKKTRELTTMLKRTALRKMIVVKECLKAQKFALNIAISISTANSLKRYFSLLSIGVKVQKIQKSLRKVQFSRIVVSIRNFNNHQKTKSSCHHAKILQKKVFSSLKNSWQTKKAIKHHQSLLLKKYFGTWLKEVHDLFYEKEQEHQDEQLLASYFQRKSQIKMLYCFSRWKQWGQNRKEERQKNTIAKQYGEVRQKVFLLRKYFEGWKMLKPTNKALLFRKQKLKMKCWECLKLHLIKGVEKWERVFKFVEQRQKKRYFQAVQTFNQNEKMKVQNFLRKRAFNKLGKAVVRQFVSNQGKAKLYHSRCLMLKSLFALKRQWDLSRKTKKAVIFIHCNMVLRRWAKAHRIREFVQGRKYVWMGKVFLELKLNCLNKRWLTTTQESSLDLERVTLESPDRLFSLDYSLSNYNSNNAFEP